MPLDDRKFGRADTVARLNAQASGLGAQDILRLALSDPATRDGALVSSFGAESVVLLHLMSQIDPSYPVIFIDTRLLFAETLDYQRDVARQLGLTDVRVTRTDPAALRRADPDDTLHQRDTAACCDLRKARPLEQALGGFSAWITGRKRFQAATRAALEPFELDGDRIKVNPLADWTAEDLKAYIADHDLPRHPLVAKGYPSIGCTPCTTPVGAGEDPRAGRWRGSDKVECGIHFVNGRAVRGPIAAPAAATAAKE